MIRSSGNGGQPRFTINNPKYLRGPKGHGGCGGSKPPPLGSNG